VIKFSYLFVKRKEKRTTTLQKEEEIDAPRALSNTTRESIGGKERECGNRIASICLSANMI